MVPEVTVAGTLECECCGVTYPNFGDFEGEECLSCEEAAVRPVECDPADDRGAFWARLQMPGYLDATDWIGPYRRPFHALRALSDTYGVHPRTGADFAD